MKVSVPKMKNFQCINRLYNFEITYEEEEEDGHELRFTTD